MTVEERIRLLENLVEYNKKYSCFTPEEIANMLEEVYRSKHILALWNEFGDIPMDPKTECICSPWHGFPTGTSREDIWHWFEKQFRISVGSDLMLI